MLFQQLLNLIFPLSCLHCGQGDELLCVACRETLILQPQTIPGGTVKTLLVAADYETPIIQTLIKAYKYHNLPQLASYLAPLLIQRLQSIPQLPPMEILPIPLHAKRLRQREYNQSLLLAQLVASHFGWKLNSDLRRNKNTSAQARLNREQRLHNLDQAFHYTGTSLVGKNVLLLDDVITTGATIEAAAAALRPHQPDSIWALALARNQSLRY
ncbi:MAG: phosphoribosyltransferase family protein [Candidatus Komeilibacteria bacterium]